MIAVIVASNARRHEAAGSRRPLSDLDTNQDDVNPHQVIDIAVYKATGNGGLIIGTNIDAVPSISRYPLRRPAGTRMFSTPRSSNHHFLLVWTDSSILPMK